MGGRRRDSTALRVRDRYDEPMEWVVLVVGGVLVLVGGYFLVRAFAKFSSAMGELKSELNTLGEMGPRLQKLAEDVNQLTDSMEQRRRQ